MLESIKKYGRKIALGAAIGSAAMSGESTAAEIPKAVTADASQDKIKAGLFEAPTVEAIKVDLGSIKFSDQYTADEKKDILNYLDLRVKIMDRFKHFIDIDQSGTDPAKLKAGLRGKQLHFGMGYNAIKKQLTDPQERKFIIPNQSIPDNPDAITAEAQRMRSALIREIQESESQDAEKSE